MANLRKEVEAQALLNSARPTSSLSCVTPRHICLHETAELAFLIEPERMYEKLSRCRTANLPHFLMLSGIDHASDVRDGNSRLSNVRGWMTRQPRSHLRTFPNLTQFCACRGEAHRRPPLDSRLRWMNVGDISRSHCWS